MSKRILKLLAVAFVFTLVVVGCTNLVDEPTPETGTTATDDTMKDDMKDDDTMDDSMKKDDSMEEDSMDKDAMDDTMKDEDSMDDTMKDEDSMDKHTMDDSMKDEEMMMTNEGSMAPDFEFMDLDGNVHKLADYKGQKVYIKYWASWCSICLAGLDEVDTLFAETDDYIVLTVVTPGANGEQSKEDFIKWFDGLGYEHINVLFDVKGEVAKELNVRAFPTSVYIGSDGVLIEVSPGHKSNDDINMKVDLFY